MAKSRPALGAMFRLKGKSSPSVQLTSMTSCQSNESNGFNSLSTGDNQFPKSSRLGNYKPKFLSQSENKQSETSEVTSRSNGGSVVPEPAMPSTSGESEKYTSRSLYDNYSPLQKSSFFNHSKNDRSSVHNSSVTTDNVKKGLKTKSSENFILMGDKDSPMVIETSGLGSSLDGDELPEELPDGETQEDNISSLTDQVLTLNDEEHNNERINESAIIAGKRDISEEAVQMTNSEGDVEQMPHLQPTVHIVNGTNDLGLDKGTDKEMPYIPPPDYDEDVMTIDIPDEDEETLDYPSAEQALSSRRVYKVYQGDDFGQYLREEESQFIIPTSRTQTRYKKSSKKSSTKTRDNNSKSLTGTLSRALFGGSKKTVSEPEKRHTIHEFSFGHSKIGLGDSVGIPNGVWRTGGERKPSRVSSSDNNRLSNYELFLQYRQNDHKKSGSIESTSDSGNETGEDTSRNTESQKTYHVTSPAYYSPNKYVKRNGLWEKLTLRFRRRSIGEIGTVN
ncbi:uncharacterized protein LOC135471310 [Liolophura sinensis]|uniref:uncharacterized protein LOC135471310 n=1 Tax=Liolophura sinensis TaxID=3198878 RepID=UPI0031584D61